MGEAQRQFGIGVVGAGMGAKPHALALQALSGSIDVRGVYRRNRAELESFCQTYGFPAAESCETAARQLSSRSASVATAPRRPRLPARAL